MTSNFCIALCFIAFIRCSDTEMKSKVIIASGFPNTKSLSGSKINGIKTDFYPLIVGLKDDLLLFCDTEHKTHFYAYKVPEFDYLGSFGNQGKGPSEVQDPVFWGQIINDKGTEKAWIYEMNKMKLSLFDISKALSSSNYKPEFSTIFPPQIGEAVNIITIDSNSVIGSGNQSYGEFFIYNSVTKGILWKPFVEKYGAAFNCEQPESRPLEYKRGILKIKPDGSKFVKAFIYLPIIDVYNNKGDLEYSIVLDNFHKPKINREENSFKGSTMLFFENVYLTDNFIYALNRNCTLEEYKNSNNVEIFVFNWEGESISKYKLNEGIASLGPFVVNEKAGEIYSVNFISEDNFIRRFKMATDEK